MEIVLQFFLNIYFLFLVVYFAFAFFNLYHFIKFGFFTPGSVFFSFLFIVGTVLMLYFSFVQIKTVDWSDSFTVFDYSKTEMDTFFSPSSDTTSVDSSN